MLKLHNLERLHKKRKRRGRGGDLGGTSGRGHKGQLARSGGSVKAFFEGGQMPLSRRLPKRGFNNIHAGKVVIINLEDIERSFNGNDVVDCQSLREKGLIRGHKKFIVKLLGNGEISKSLQVHVHKSSASAHEAVKRAGGSVHLIKETDSGRVTS